jgi:hypothetical protein
MRKEMPQDKPEYRSHLELWRIHRKGLPQSQAFDIIAFAYFGRFRINNSAA